MFYVSQRIFKNRTLQICRNMIILIFNILGKKLYCEFLPNSDIATKPLEVSGEAASSTYLSNILISINQGFNQ